MKKWRQCLFSLFAVCLGLMIAPLTAMAAEETGVYVGNVDSYQALQTDTYYKTDTATGAITIGTSNDYNVLIEKRDDGNGSYKYVLTLNNATIKGVDGTNQGAGIYTDAFYPLEIKLNGINTVTAGKDTYPVAIFGGYESLTIYSDSNGVLNANADTTNESGTTADISCAIYASYVNINSGTVNATAGAALKASSGICAYYEVNISGASTSVTASGGDVTNGNSCGISSTYYDSYTEDDVVGIVNISGGTVVATGGKAGATDATTVDKEVGYSHGIGSRDLITITGGNITAKADEAAKNSYGIGSVNTITIVSGVIRANGGTAGADSFGIGTFGNFNIGGDAKIYAYGGNVTNGNSYGIGIATDEDGLFNPSTTPGADYNYHDGGQLTVSGGDAVVEVNGGESKNGTSVGLGATEDITVQSGATVTGNGGNGGDTSVGIVAGGALNVLTNGNVKGAAADSQTSIGVGVIGDGGITVDNGILSGSGGNASAGYSAGIASQNGITAKNNSKLSGIGGNVTGAKGDGSEQDGNSYGLSTFGNLNILNSELNAQSKDAYNSTYGVGAEGDVTYTNAKVTAKSGNATNGDSNGMGTLQNANIDGGSLNFVAGNAPNGKSFGVGAILKIYYKNPTLTAEGIDAAFGTAGGVANLDGNTYNLYSVDANGKLTLLDATTLLTAKNITIAEIFAVTFAANDGTGTMDIIYVFSGNNITLPENGFTAPEGKQFKAWSIGGTEYAVGATYKFTADTTVKAVWEEAASEPIVYIILDGNNSTYAGSGDHSMRASGDVSKFLGVKVDGKVIQKDIDYIVTSGSTIVTLKETFMKTLAVGKHSLTYMYTDGEVTGYFYILAAEVTPAPTAEPEVTPAPTTKPVVTPAPTAKPVVTPAPTAKPVVTVAPATAAPVTPAPVLDTVPKTGDDANLGLLIALMVIAGMAFITCVEVWYKRKFK